MRRIALWPASLVVLIAAGCGSTSAARVNGPDGSPNWYALDCSQSESACLQKAGEVCPTGYEVSQRKVNNQPVMTTYEVHMLVRCRRPDETAATDGGVPRVE